MLIDNRVVPKNIEKRGEIAGRLSTKLTEADLPGIISILISFYSLVRDRALMSSIYASKILNNQDSYCLEYLKTYREKKISV